MKNILDDNLEQQPEAVPQNFTPLIRYVVSGFILATETRNTYRQMRWFNDNYSPEYLSAILLYGLGIIAMLCFVYYNVQQAKYERVHGAPNPMFHRWAALLIITYSVLLSSYFWRRTLFAFKKAGADFNAFSFSLVGLLIVYLIYVEIGYLRKRKNSPQTDL